MEIKKMHVVRAVIARATCIFLSLVVLHFLIFVVGYREFGGLELCFEAKYLRRIYCAFYFQMW